MKKYETKAIKDVLFEVKHNLENVGNERTERDNELLNNCNIGLIALEEDLERKIKFIQSNFDIEVLK